jgi:hypothetical protein
MIAINVFWELEHTDNSLLAKYSKGKWHKGVEKVLFVDVPYNHQITTKSFLPFSHQEFRSTWPSTS